MHTQQEVSLRTESNHNSNACAARCRCYEHTAGYTRNTIMKRTVFCGVTPRSAIAGRAMAQAVSCRPPTAEARVRSRVSPCGICGGRSSIGTGFSPSTSVFPCQCHSTGALLLGKAKKKKIIIIVIFITGLLKKSQGCGASVACAAGQLICSYHVEADTTSQH
jgi:hypothetical protein